MIIVFIVITTVPSMAIARQSIPAMGNRDATVVAAVPGFVFHSDFWLNLHDYLYGIAGGGPFERSGFDPEDMDCFGSLTGEKATGWMVAEAYYREHMGTRHHRRDPLIRAVRHRLTNRETEYDPDSERATVLELLGRAAPAYQTCLWAMHDARNRRRIAELVGLLAVYGPQLQHELADYYQDSWPKDITLDVVSYSDYAGANTSSEAHTMLSSTEPNIAGFDGLELVLHEATHLIFGFRWGRVSDQMNAVSDSLGVQTPDDLWHALSFYTSGEAVAQVAWAHGNPGFEPYAKRTGMFDRVYGGYLEPIEQYWQPYLNGEVDLKAALVGLIGAITTADQQ
jgi:hypothetical protein